MSKFEKLLLKILSGASDRNISFNELCNLLERLGFEMRVKGSHDIFWKMGVEEIINASCYLLKRKNKQVVSF